jgi:medium-chain acyl-[acyl-carrier-protein] hydrolase
MTASRSAVNSNLLWFEHLSRGQAPSLRLFCFPYAGGTSDVYRSWQRWFSEQIDLCLVHLPGRGKRLKERTFTQTTPLVEAIADRMAPETDVPYALYGHSMGATIAFELTHELIRRRCAPPQHLFVSGRRAPHCPRTEPTTFNLPHDEFIAELRRLNGTPSEVLENPELIELFMGLLRADFELVETYQYQPTERLSCPITVYGGVHDKEVSVESCHAWKEQTSANCKVKMVNGDHFFIRNPIPDFMAGFRSDVLSAVPASRMQEICDSKCS